MSWTPTTALHRGIGIAAVVLLAAAALGRVELVVLAVPFALGTALSLVDRPARPPGSALTLDEPSSVEGGPVAARVRVTSEADRPLLCVVNVQLPGWIRLEHGAGHYAALIRPRATSGVLLRGTARRWGAYRLGPASTRTVACDGLLVARSDVLPAVPLTVYPVSTVFDSEEALPRAAGISGIHRSRRLGTGRRHYLSALEWLSAVDAVPTGMAPGDRLVMTGLQPPTALVIVLTPLLDQDSANLLATLVRAGRSPVAVDTLPERIHPPVTSEWTTAGFRLWHLERANTIGRLRGVGVPVEPWRGAGSLDLMLRHVYRLAAGARVVVR